MQHSSSSTPPVICASAQTRHVHAWISHSFADSGRGGGIPQDKKLPQDHLPRVVSPSLQRTYQSRRGDIRDGCEARRPGCPGTAGGPCAHIYQSRGGNTRDGEGIYEVYIKLGEGIYEVCINAGEGIYQADAKRGGLDVLRLLAALAQDALERRGGRRRLRRPVAHLCLSGFSISEQSVSRNVEQFRGGLVLTAHTLLYHVTRGLRVIKKKRKLSPDLVVMRGGGGGICHRIEWLRMYTQTFGRSIYKPKQGHFELREGGGRQRSPLGREEVEERQHRSVLVLHTNSQVQSYIRTHTPNIRRVHDRDRSYIR